MAPSTRARRQAGAVTNPRILSAADGVSVPSRSARIDDNNDAGYAQDPRLWTPEPEPYDEEAYTAWGRKHYGDDWYEQRELMFRERNFLKPSVDDDHVYLERQKALREIELGREQGKLLLDKGKTWQELEDWARMHYGEAWYAQRQAVERDEQEKREAVDPADRQKKGRKAYKRREKLREMQWDRDEEMLAQGKTWQEIMAWPPQPSSVMQSVEAGDGVSANALRSPSISSDGNSMISTYPPTPTDVRREAKDGPQPTYPNKGQSSDLNWERAMGSANWEGLEWDAVARRLSEAQYEKYKRGRVNTIGAKRSLRENLECDRRDLDERLEIGVLRHRDWGEQERREKERERRRRDLDLRQKGWTQEDIDAMDREKDARSKEYREQKERRRRMGPRNQEEMNLKIGVWEISGISYEEQDRLARMYGFYEMPPPNPHHFKPPMVKRPPPRNQEEMDQLLRRWEDLKTLSHREQNELARMYGFDERPASPEGHDGSQEYQPSRLSLAEDTSRKTRNGRITKNTRQRQSSTRFSGTQAAPLCRKRQRKTYEKERASRRLAGQLPEFGSLPGRGEIPLLYEASLRQPSNTRKTSSLGPRSGRLSKKPIAAKGAKPQGISKSRQTGTGRRKRLAKGSKG